MGGLINAIFLLALCLIIFIESLKKFIQPSAVDEPLIVCIVGGIGEGLVIYSKYVYYTVPYKSNP